MISLIKGSMHASEFSDSFQGAKKVLISSTSFVDFGTVLLELMSAFQLIPYQSVEDAVFKALGVD